MAASFTAGLITEPIRGRLAITGRESKPWPWANKKLFDGSQSYWKRRKCTAGPGAGDSWESLPNSLSFVRRPLCLLWKYRSGRIAIAFLGIDLVLARFLAVLFQICHKWRSAGSHIGWIRGHLAALLVDVCCRVLVMHTAKSFDTSDARIVRISERGLADCALLDIAPHGWPGFDSLQERAMRRRHVLAHFRQINAQRIITMGNSQHRIQTWHDRALRPCLAAELLRLPFVVQDAF